MSSDNKDIKIKITKNGPLIVSGGIPLHKEIIIVDNEGEPKDWERGEEFNVDESYALCRCGRSGNKPFCDGAHIKSGFNGAENPEKNNYLKIAYEYPGPGVDLTDAERLCASARFCHRAGGTWKLVEESDDPKSKKTAIEESCNCPSGRLVTWYKETHRPIEPDLEPSIGIVEDPFQELSGPLWVKGRVPVESIDGSLFEQRNRVTLCRCGASENKPFCDSSHVDIEFDDEL